jgi:riboflavin biosynthesis pyrimidine reductase
MHIAPVISGGDNAAGIFAGPAAATMADMWRGRVVSTTNLDGDIEIILEPNLN